MKAQVTQDEMHGHVLLDVFAKYPNLEKEFPDLAAKARESLAGACFVQQTLEAQEDDERSRHKEQARRSTLDTYTAAELEREEFPPLKYAVPDLLPEGLTFLVGSPKIGKSWLSLDIALAVGLGGKALGSIDVDQGAVLYFALEDNKRRMQKRIRALLGDQHFPDKLTITHRCPPLGGGLEQAITAWLTANPSARLVIVDTLARVRKQRGRNGDQYQDDADTIAKLQTLATDHNVAILVVHHDRKAEAEDVLATISGTFGLSGSADGALMLKRSRGEADATLFVTGRDIENEQELALRFLHGAWLLMGDAKEYAMTKERQDVVNLLKKSDRPLSPKEIAELLEKKTATVRWMLSDMAKQGQIKATDYGKYTHI